MKAAASLTKGSRPICGILSGARPESKEFVPLRAANAR
jgi:hypothetical protein